MTTEIRENITVWLSELQETIFPELIARIKAIQASKKGEDVVLKLTAEIFEKNE